MSIFQEIVFLLQLFNDQIFLENNVLEKLNAIVIRRFFIHDLHSTLRTRDYGIWANSNMVIKLLPGEQNIGITHERTSQAAGA